MITGYPSIEGAVEAIKIGADDFLAKPYTDDELISVVRRALERLTAQRAAQSTYWNWTHPLASWATASQ
jgi:two-component system response regulator HydG